jgi:hypothetical protein
MTSKKTIQQHYVPQSYLIRWGTNEQVNVYDKHESKQFVTHVKNVAGEREFNDYSGTLNESDKATFQMFEREFARIEAEAANLSTLIEQGIKASY